MKLSKAPFFLLGAFALVTSSPVPAEPVKILRSDFYIQPEGAYKFGFETESKIVRREFGEIKIEESKDEQVIVVRGSYSYLDPEGHPITVTF